VLIGLLFAISGINVINSYVGRDFMTAFSDRDGPGSSGWRSPTRVGRPPTRIRSRRTGNRLPDEFDPALTHREEASVSQVKTGTTAALSGGSRCHDGERSCGYQTSSRWGPAP
jgi:hypothetical protein